MEGGGQFRGAQVFPRAMGAEDAGQEARSAGQAPIEHPLAQGAGQGQEGQGQDGAGGVGQVTGGDGLVGESLKAADQLGFGGGRRVGAGGGGPGQQGGGVLGRHRQNHPVMVATLTLR